MKPNPIKTLVADARADLAALDLRELKRLRKAVRKMILKDVQRRAITGEPSSLRRNTYP